MFAFGKYIFSTRYLKKLAWSFLAGHFKIALISASAYHYQLDESVSKFYNVWYTFLFYFQYKFLQANSVDHDQTPCSVASDRGLLCLPMSLGTLQYMFLSLRNI